MSRVPGALLVIIGSSLLASCVHVQRYPETWAQIEELAPDECAAVAGTYTDLGTSGGKNPQPVSLNLLLINDHTRPNVTTVRLEQPDSETLEVSAWGEDTELNRLHLALATDGSLVVRQWDSAAGPFVGMAESLWFRFTPLHGTPAP
ncbi:MAG: hypothetical protein ACREAA_17800 [Candidatus Polarisedimenticolia bacterium]